MFLIDKRIKGFIFLKYKKYIKLIMKINIKTKKYFIKLINYYIKKLYNEFKLIINIFFTPSLIF